AALAAANSGMDSSTSVSRSWLEKLGSVPGSSPSSRGKDVISATSRSFAPTFEPSPSMTISLRTPSGCVPPPPIDGASPTFPLIAGSSAEPAPHPPVARVNGSSTPMIVVFRFIRFICSVRSPGEVVRAQVHVGRPPVRVEHDPLVLDPGFHVERRAAPDILARGLQGLGGDTELLAFLFGHP